MTKGFSVILIDPPWRYASRANDSTHRARNQYPDITLDEIKALPVRELASADCVLWLWTTNAFLREAIKILDDAWDFDRKDIITWVKDKMGTGDWLRGRTEHCLLAIRGNPAHTPPTDQQSTLLFGPMREYARKPDEFYQLVESLIPAQESGSGG